MVVDLLIKNASQLVTAVRERAPVADKEVGEQLLIIEDGALAASGGTIEAIGESSRVLKSIELHPSAAVIDATGKTVLPGFIDPHTHPVFAGTRENEFEMRLQGKSYLQIARSGGGILSSVRSLRQTSKEQLITAAIPRLNRFLASGTTTIEAKSGYGLTVEDEIKSLEVIRELNRMHPIELIPTFLGGHEVPTEYRHNRAGYVDLIVEELLPRVAEAGLADFCDVFCEEGVFTIEESRRILEAGKAHGLTPKIHAEQLSKYGGAELAAEVGAISADHLDFVSLKDISILKKAGVVPVLLPGSVFFLGAEKYAPARVMIEHALPVALATDLNPGTCMTESMPFMTTLACVKMRMTPAEALIAATLHSAKAVGRSDIGVLEVGSQADCVVWDMPNYLHLPYHFGVELTETVVKRGEVVWQRQAYS